MAKRTRKSPTVDTAAADVPNEGKLADFAQDLGNLLGQAQSKADHWLAQRKAMVDHLMEVRDTASRLLAQLGLSAPARRGRKPAADAAPTAKAATRTPAGRKKRRTMSEEARAKISAAQRARWAKQKKAAKE